jgi:hypothetical protein
MIVFSACAKEAARLSIETAGAMPKFMVYANNTYVVPNCISVYTLLVALSSAD